MSFKDEVLRDIENVFFNENEFAEPAYFYKKGLTYDSSSENTPVRVSVVFYPEIYQFNYGSLTGSETGDYVLYIKKYNKDENNNVIEIKVELEDYIYINSYDEFFVIDQIKEETMGSWTCNCINRVLKDHTRSRRQFRS